MDDWILATVQHISDKQYYYFKKIDAGSKNNIKLRSSMDDSLFVVTVFPVVLHSNPGKEALLGEFKPLILRGKSNM